MRLLRDGLVHLPAYLWSGWGAVASLLLALAAWEALSAHYGPLVLPDPRSVFTAFVALVERGAAWSELGATARRVGLGFGAALLAGSALGLAAGVSMTASMVSRPLVTVLMGTPPIAWLVLAMLWFGAGDGTPVFTVFVASFPVVFVGALQGARTLDNDLQAMAKTFRLPRRMMLVDVYLPHVVSYLLPAAIVALGLSWKVAVMAELFATQNGVGAELAVSRSQLDTATTMAWISAVVGALLAIEYLLLEPLRREIERWRDPDAKQEAGA